MTPNAELITLGGTAGLIGYLLYTVYQFGSGHWVPKSAVEAAEQRTAEANARTEKAIESGTVAAAATEALTDELRAYRSLVERLVNQRGDGA